MRHPHFPSVILAAVLAGTALFAQDVPYLKLTDPVRILPEPQAWEGDQQPHTLSVVELNRGGFKYWGYYGLNEGRGTGLCRSNDLVHWTKYEKNPLWTKARWTSVVAGADPAHPGRLHLAITRDYNTAQSHMVLASSDDGIHLKELKVLVPKGAAPRNRTQNPNLYRDPLSGKFVLTFYRGNDDNYFDIVQKSAANVLDLDKAEERVLMHDTATVAAPTLLYVKNVLGAGKGVYYLVTEIYPGRYATPPAGEWQVKVFWSEKLEGPYVPCAGNPVQAKERACLFQHVFNGRYYGYQSHLEHPSEKWIMELIEAPLP
jgi:hypothetical protein